MSVKDGFPIHHCVVCRCLWCVGNMKRKYVLVRYACCRFQVSSRDFHAKRPLSLRVQHDKSKVDHVHPLTGLTSAKQLWKLSCLEILVL